jgi:hypothetical protein
MYGEIKLGKNRSIDDALLEAAVMDLSAEETSARLNGVLSPARVMVRWKELLRSNTWLEAAEREQALLRVLQKNLVDLQNAELMGAEGFKIQLSYIRQLFERLDKRQAATEEQLNTYNENVGRQLGRVVDMTLKYMQGALREVIEPAKWDELVQEALVMAQVEIAKKQVEA